jgi:hypothetical protein
MHVPLAFAALLKRDTAKPNPFKFPLTLSNEQRYCLQVDMASILRSASLAVAHSPQGPRVCPAVLQLLYRHQRWLHGRRRQGMRLVFHLCSVSGHTSYIRTISNPSRQLRPSKVIILCQSHIRAISACRRWTCFRKPDQGRLSHSARWRRCRMEIPKPNE